MKNATLLVTLAIALGAAPPQKTNETLTTLDDPAYMRVKGGYVKLACMPFAISEARVNVDKKQVLQLIKDASEDQNVLLEMMLEDELPMDKYVKGAEAALVAARGRLAKLLGAENNAKVEAAYSKPYTSAQVYLNRMRAAVAGTGQAEEVKAADDAISAQLARLAELAKDPQKRTPAAIESVRKQALADVVSALGEKRRTRFEKLLNALCSYDSPTTKPTTAPAKQSR